MGILMRHKAFLALNHKEDHWKSEIGRVKGRTAGEVEESREKLHHHFPLSPTKRPKYMSLLPFIALTKSSSSLFFKTCCHLERERKRERDWLMCHSPSLYIYINLGLINSARYAGQ